MQWLNEERLVPRLVEMIDPSQTPEVGVCSMFAVLLVILWHWFFRSVCESQLSMQIFHF